LIKLKILGAIFGIGGNCRHCSPLATPLQRAGTYRRQMAPGARNKLGAPMFEPKAFQKQLYCIEKSTCDIGWTFRCPHSDSAIGELCPLSPSSLRLW